MPPKARDVRQAQLVPTDSVAESDPESSGEEEPFDKTYYVIYAISIATIIFGIINAWLLTFLDALMQDHHAVKLIGGNGLIACGIFLLLNGDLVVTFWRLRKEIGRFRENNKEFEKLNEKNAKEVRRLTIAKDAFEQLDKRFSGNVKQAAAEAEKLEATAASDMLLNAKSICHIYVDKDKDGMISDGAEMNEAFDILELTFGGIFKSFPERRKLIKEGFNQSKVYKEQKGLHINQFSDVFGESMIDMDFGTITKKVVDILEKK